MTDASVKKRFEDICALAAKHPADRRMHDVLVMANAVPWLVEELKALREGWDAWMAFYGADLEEPVPPRLKRLAAAHARIAELKAAKP
jgi:hypothetical protein